MKRLYVAISHHGYGHLAQTAPVLSALADLQPDLDLIVRSALPIEILKRRIGVRFRHIDLASDCNFVMHDSVRLDLPASLAAYQAFHAGWERRVVAEAAELERLGVDLVFSNVGYLPLAAAQSVGVPSLAMCSLNWADIFEHYLGREPGISGILAAMKTAYAGTGAFLRPTPSMPMADLSQAETIQPIAQVGVNCRALLNERLNLRPTDQLVLVGLGGIPHRLPVQVWPDLPGTVYLFPDSWGISRYGLFGFEKAGLSYADLLASVDTLITKPGYGSFVEATASGVPVLTLPRPDWPETPCLMTWLERYGRVLEISAETLESGRLADPLERLWSIPEKPLPEMKGAAEAARIISASLA